MKTFSKLFVAGLVAISLLGCSGEPIKIASITDQNTVDTSKGRKISASASGFQLLLFIPLKLNSRHKRAYQALLDQAGADYITDVKVKESWAYAFVGTVYSTTIEATAYPKISK